MKDDSLPYIYLDEEDEDKRKRKKSAAKPKPKTSDSLPYVYVDEDEDDDRYRRTNKTRSASGSTPKASAGAKSSASKKSNAKSSSAKNHNGKSSNGKRNDSSKKKNARKSSAGAAIGIVVALVLVLAVGALALDATGILNLGIWNLITGKNDSTVHTTSNPSGTTDEFVASWMEANNDSQDDNLNQSESGSLNVTADQLNINPNLPDEWMNILLLGTDSRVSYEASRSDTMMICSINKLTGQVKLTSIMRDTVVSMNIKGTTRQEKINSAYFYGGTKNGALAAMSVVNQTFNMNIDTYVVVNFAGFAQIAEALGGVEMDVTDAELVQLNHNVAEQYYLLYTSGQMSEEDARNAYYATKLETAGKGIHLNGMQTLGYARIRKIDSDYERASRQRKVLNALLTKMRGADSATIMNLVMSNYVYVTTNMKIGDIPQLAMLVLSSDIETMEELRLPKQGTYKEDTRNNISGLYDMNIDENRRELYTFIYGN